MKERKDLLDLVAENERPDETENELELAID